MSEITTINPAGQAGSFEVVPTDLTGADTLAYNQSKKQALYINNTTASPVTINIDGDESTTVNCAGLGSATDVSLGYGVTVPAGEVHAVQLANIRAFLQGAVNVTGGATGVLAWIQEG